MTHCIPGPLQGFRWPITLVPRGCIEGVFASPAISTQEHSVLRIPFPMGGGGGGEAILETGTGTSLVQRYMG